MLKDVSTHLCLFSIVGEVVQVEGTIHGVVVHLQRARLVTLFVKQESSSVGWAIVCQPWASVLQPLKAAPRVLKLKFSGLFSAGLIFMFQIQVEISCCYYCQENRAIVSLLKRAESLKELLWGVNFTSGS